MSTGFPQLKLNIIGRRRPGTTQKQHRHHIREVHGERVLDYIRQQPDSAPQRYVQHVVTDGTFRAGPRDAPFTLGLDFVTQIWMPGMQALRHSINTSFYKDHLKHDEDEFVDQSTVAPLPCRERLMHEGDGTAAGWKLFFLLKRAAEVDEQAFDQAWSATALQAFAHLRHVQNVVLAPPGGTPPINGIDEFWLADEAAAHAHLHAWRQHLEATLVAPGLIDASASLALIAREDVVYAGTRSIRSPCAAMPG